MAFKMINKSPTFSFKGWQLGKLLKGNKEAAKIALSFLLGLIVPADPVVKVLVGGIGKALMDTLDFYCTNVELKE
jgi:hypothetical protein